MVKEKESAWPHSGQATKGCTVSEENIVELKRQALVGNKDELDQLLSQGAQKLLGAAIENEVAEYIERHRGARDGRGHQQVVRNGRLPERQHLL